MKAKTSSVSQIAICHNCDKQWEDYVNHRARKAAYAHAKKTGHTVTVETAVVTMYNDK